MSSARRLPAFLLALLASAPTLLAGGGGGDPAEDPAATSGGARWGAEYFPNVPLITQDGKTVHFFDDLIRDKVVVINFIYTSCPDACPLETAKLVEVYSLLGDRVGKDVFFYSVSIDPERDTPEVLKEYAERYQVGDGWLFLTGEPANIKVVRQKLGMIRPDEESLSDHTLSLLIGNQSTGIWMKRSPMENPYLLSTQIGSWLHNWKDAPEPGHDYKDAPKLRSISRGENLFRTRCATCHVIGPDDGIIRQGPNLTGVMERRDRDWLARWLAEPDKMLAEKDPIALELFAANRNLPMPNMRLNEIEVEALLAFMEEESARVLEEMRQAEDDWAMEDSSGEDDLPSCCQKRDGLILFEDERADGASAAAAASDADAAWSRRIASGYPSESAAPAAPRARSDRGGVSLAFAASTTICLGLAMALGILSFVVRREGGR